jgi:hypothetical protein
MLTKMNSELNKNNGAKETWRRLLEVLKAKNLDEAAQKLHMNASTLRGRKARNALPYDNIVHELNGKQLSYVLKNEYVVNLQETESEPIVLDLASTEHTIKKRGNSNSFAKERPEERVKSKLEKRLVSLINNVENAPFSRSAKLMIIGSLISIGEKSSRRPKHAGSEKTAL